jgi:hypothetical protein
MTSIPMNLCPLLDPATCTSAIVPDGGRTERSAMASSSALVAR